MVTHQELRTMSAYELVKLLDEQYPHACIRADEDAVQAHRYAGLRELIDILVDQVREESEPT